MKKRSDFEHKALARGSTPLDFARYVAWEISLESLRAKRVKRLHITGSTSHIGQARIQSIFDRATRKHPGDLGLWTTYLGYAISIKSSKKVKTVLTSAIRLHPTKAELWLYAAKYCLEEESDVNSARSYMQRGTRFCNRTPQLWIEYAKLEMIFLQKISMRRRILGLDAPVKEDEEMVDNDEKEQQDEGKVDDEFAESADVIALPDAKISDMKVASLRPSMIEGVAVDAEAIQDPINTPALNGAIPIAIFDDARNQPFYSVAAAEEFFNMFAAFSNVHCQAKIVQHVMNKMMEQFGKDAATLSCYIKQPVIGIDATTAMFPVALTAVLERANTSIQETKDRPLLAKKVIAWMAPILEIDDLDPGVQTVVKVIIKKLVS